jgi:hypothetical protein
MHFLVKNTTNQFILKSLFCGFAFFRSFVHFQTFKSMTDRTHMQHSSWQQSTTSLNISKGSISSYDGPQYDEDEDGEGSKLQQH